MQKDINQSGNFENLKKAGLTRERRLNSSNSKLKLFFISKVRRRVERYKMKFRLTYYIDYKWAYSDNFLVKYHYLIPVTNIAHVTLFLDICLTSAAPQTQDRLLVPPCWCFSFNGTSFLLVGKWPLTHSWNWPEWGLAGWGWWGALGLHRGHKDWLESPLVTTVPESPWSPLQQDGWCHSICWSRTAHAQWSFEGRPSLSPRALSSQGCPQSCFSECFPLSVLITELQPWMQLDLLSRMATYFTIQPRKLLRMKAGAIRY